MKDERHFITGNFKPKDTFLPDEEYAKVLDNVVIACIDVILINKKGEILLGKRNNEPYPGWWVFGGRMKPGESFETTIARNVKREVNIDVDPDRFHYFNTYSLVYERRAQEPKENGAHTVTIVMVLKLNNFEEGEIKINEEHEEMKWIKPKDIIIDSSFHPGLRKIVQDFLGSVRI